MPELKIVVCLRQVPDPNASPANFVVEPGAKKVATIGVPPVINPFDENALEAAIRLKERHGASVIALCIGEKLSKPIMTKALAVGADDLILLEDEEFNGVDVYTMAHALAQGIKKIGEYDLILTGSQSSDWGFGQIGIVLAEILQIPYIGTAQQIEVTGSGLLVKRATISEYQTIQVAMPTLITADSLLGELRLPTLKATVLARKHSVTAWKKPDISTDSLEKKYPKLVYEISPPPPSQRNCRMIDGESADEMAGKLALALYNT